MRVNKLAVIRIRGSGGIKEEVKDTLEMLNLNKSNYCVIVDDNSSYRGMLKEAKEMLTWGPIKADVLEDLFLERGEFEGDGEVTDEKIDERTPYNSVSELVEAVSDGEYELKDVDGLKDVFRLHPPKKGYDSVKLSFEQGGAKGDRGEKINDLISRML